MGSPSCRSAPNSLRAALPTSSQTGNGAAATNTEHQRVSVSQSRDTPDSEGTDREEGGETRETKKPSAEGDGKDKGESAFDRFRRPWPPESSEVLAND